MVLVGAAFAQNTSLPTVDLGYEIYRASGFNVSISDVSKEETTLNKVQDTGRFYNFSNIRYAAPPIGNLRFAPPEAPAENRSSINDGSVGRSVLSILFEVDRWADYSLVYAPKPAQPGHRNQASSW